MDKKFKKLGITLGMFLMFTTNVFAGTTVIKEYRESYGNPKTKYTMTETSSKTYTNVLEEYLTDRWNTGASTLSVSYSKSKSTNLTISGTGDTDTKAAIKAGFSFTHSKSKSVTVGATYNVDPNKSSRLAYIADYNVRMFDTKKEVWTSDPRSPLKYNSWQYKDKAVEPTDLYIKVVYKGSEPRYTKSEL